MKQKVVIIGHGYLSRLSLIRSVGSAGYEVIVIVTMYGPLNTTKPIDCHSKYVSKFFYCNAKDEDGLIKLLLNDCTASDQKVVIIPDSDFSAAFVDRNRDSLSPFFIFPYILDDTHYVSDWMDKEKQKQLARKLGISTPGTTKLHIENNIIPSLSGVRYPCFTKSLATIGGGKQWFRRCNDKEELQAALSSFAKSEAADILVEDYIDIEQEFAVVGLTDGDSVFIPGVIQFIENCKKHLGIARKGKIVPLAGFENLIDKFSTYVKETRFKGLFDIDFLYSHGCYYFCEMNFRFGGSGYAYTCSGVNLPALYVDMMCGNMQWRDENKTITEEKIYVNERMLLDDLKSLNISLKQFDAAINSADIRFTYDINDPKPHQLFKRTVFKEKVKYVIKKLIKGL